MLPELRETLLRMQQRDLARRAELAADGTLFDGYHPRMEAVHKENAAALRQLIAEFGWPHEELAGPDGAEAAWLVAQHAISEPDFMRHCRDLVASEVAAGRLPQWQHAYLDDRIRVSEGKPQRFGTQIEITPDGPVVCEVEHPEDLHARRKAAGLGLLSARLTSMQDEARPTPETWMARKAAEARWRRKVGWDVS